MSELRKKENNLRVDAPPAPEASQRAGGACAFSYFVCESRREAEELKAKLGDFASGKGMRINGFFYDIAGRQPYVLLNLIDICSKRKNAKLLAPSPAHIGGGGLAEMALNAHAARKGLRIIYAEPKRERLEIGGTELGAFPVRVFFLQNIANYFGFGQDRSNSASPGSRGGKCIQGRLPLGFVSAHGRICVDERGAEAVREIFARFARLETPTGIIDAVKKRYPDINCPTRNNIYSLICNPRYIGRGESAFPPIIENRLYLDACAALEKRGICEREHLFLLDSLSCAGGIKLLPIEYSSRLHTSAYASKGAKPKLSVRADEAEAAVLSCVCESLSGEIPELRRLCTGSASFAGLFHTEALALESELDEAVDELLSSSKGSSAYARKFSVRSFDELSARCRLLKIRIAHLEYLHGLFSVTEEMVNEYLGRLSSLETASRREKRFFLDHIVKNVSIDENELIVSVYCPRGIKRIRSALCARLVAE